MKELFKSILFYFGIINIAAGFFFGTTLLNNSQLSLMAVPIIFLFSSIGILSILVAREIIKHQKK